MIVERIGGVNLEYMDLTYSQEQHGLSLHPSSSPRLKVQSPRGGQPNAQISSPIFALRYKALAEENAAALKKIESFTFEMDIAEKKQQKDMFKLKKFFERKLGEKDVFIHQLKDEIEENKQWVRGN